MDRKIIPLIPLGKEKNTNKLKHFGFECQTQRCRLGYLMWSIKIMTFTKTWEVIDSVSFLITFAWIQKLWEWKSKGREKEKNGRGYLYSVVYKMVGGVGKIMSGEEPRCGSRRAWKLYDTWWHSSSCQNLGHFERCFSV